MPHRWISMRGPTQTNESREDDNADINFVLKTVEVQKNNHRLGLESPSVAYSFDIPRPKTSSGVSQKRAQPRRPQEINTTRPRTSEARSSPAFTSGKSPGPTEIDDMIGVAYGSPTHPPANFFGVLDSIAPIDTHAFEQRGPFLDDTSQEPKSKWRKFGFLFKGKHSNSQKQPANEPFYKVQVGEGLENRQETARETLTSQRQDLDSPSDRLSEESTTVEHFPEPPRTSHGIASDNGQDQWASGAASRASLPKLQVDIPSANMDRYTLMFGNVPGVQNSNLVARRSKVLEQLRSKTEDLPPLPTLHLHSLPSEDQSRLATSSTAVGRQTSPTFPRPSYSLYPTASPLASRSSTPFSLFPNTSTTNFIPTFKGHRPSDSPLKRSVTSPACMSPMRDTFEVEKPQPLRVRKNSGRWVASPEQSTASTEQTAIWSAGIVISPVSTATTIEDEILFDVKSFRDSAGLEGQQFEMTRPSSTAVALYRTLSQKAKVQRPGREIPRSMSPQDVETDVDDTRTIDETIAVVEQLAAPAATKPTSPSNKSHVGHLVGSSPKEKGKSNLRYLDSSSTPAAQPAAVSQITAVIHKNASLIAPPVPAKDSKFIPVSKYAAKGSRPSRPLRSVTESAALRYPRSKHNATKYPASRSDESLAALFPQKPTRAAHLRPILAQSSIPVPDSPIFFDPKKSAVTTVSAVITPVAEVSVARTISLSRKESKRILVNHNPSAKQRLRVPEVQDEWNEEEKRRTRMELLDKRMFSPVFVEVERGHRIGKSVNALIEDA